MSGPALAAAGMVNPGGAVIHHLGFVCPDVEEGVLLHQAFGFTLEAPATEDPLQQVRVAFLRDAHGARIELLAPAGENSPVRAFLDKGGGLHHVCYLTPDLDAALAALRGQNFLVLREPVPACALGGARIAFAYSRSMQLIELLECAP